MSNNPLMRIDPLVNLDDYIFKNKKGDEIGRIKDDGVDV